MSLANVGDTLHTQLMTQLLENPKTEWADLGVTSVEAGNAPQNLTTPGAVTAPASAADGATSAILGTSGVGQARRSLLGRLVLWVRHHPGYSASLSEQTIARVNRA